MNVPWAEPTGVEIGAAWLLAAIAPVGDFGRRVRANERAFRVGDESAARAAIARVAAVARDATGERLEALRDAIARVPDVGAALARAAVGGPSDDVDFFEIACLVDALATVAHLADGVVTLAGAVPTAPDELRAALAPGRGRGGSFYLDDAFDDALARARATATTAQARYDVARGRAVARVARALGEEVRDGEFVLARERAAAPLPPSVRVLREAPTYLSCEIVPDDATLAALAERDRATEDVATCEETVRARLTRVVARAAAKVADACVAVGTLDALVARARFARRYEAMTVPHLARDRTAAFYDARYLPIASALTEAGRPYEPISLELASVGVVTGPNMGGKTAALRTLGFLVACVACGVPVPARSASLPLVGEIVWLGGGATSDDGHLLSAFGREAIELRDFLRRDNVRPVALVDEFARTTTPREGRALLVALVETLRERGAIGLVATHLDGVATATAAPHYSSGGIRAFAPGDAAGADDLVDALARIARATDYRIRRAPEDARPPSDALALAETLGLDAPLIARARDALV